MKIKTKRTTIRYITPPPPRIIVVASVWHERRRRTAARPTKMIFAGAFYSFHSPALRGGNKTRAQNLVTGQTRHPFETDIAFSSTSWKCSFLHTHMHTQIIHTYACMETQVPKNVLPTLVQITIHRIAPAVVTHKLCRNYNTV